MLITANKEQPEREEFSNRVLSYYYGELIKETRKEKHLTQQELADKIGKERAYIAKIEQGKTDMQISNFVQIINALGLSLQILRRIRLFILLDF